MTDTISVLLAIRDSAVARAIAVPGAAVLFPADRIRDIEPGSRMFCFVDWLLPDLSGIEFCRLLRSTETTASAHITMVLESSEAEDKRRALRAGADDYIDGPLSAAKLRERMELYLANGAHAVAERNERRLVLGGLSVDPAAHQVRWHGELIALAPSELRLLVHFLSNPDRLFDRCALIEQIGKPGEVHDDRTVDVWIGRLRRALARHGIPDPIRTVRSRGYVLDSPGA